MTLTSRLSAIAQAHALLRLPFDLRNPELRKALQGIARSHGTRPQRRAAPLLTADVVRLAAACGGDPGSRPGQALRGERDRALILLGFAGAFRRAELVALRVADLTFSRHGLSVLLPRSKADQLGEGAVVHVAASPLAAHCPVARSSPGWPAPGSLRGRCSAASPATAPCAPPRSPPRRSG